MRILFLHPNFPAQYRHMAVALGRDENNEVVFGTQAREGEIPGVRKIYYKTAREPARETHHYVRPLERAVLTGQAVFRAVLELKKQGFVPDIVCGHSGWGVTQFIKDAYPTAPLLGFYEWYYHAIGTDVDFLSEDEVSADNMARVRVKNAAILLDLAACDWGVTPTAWQLQQFPALFSSKLLQLHEGVDTNYFTPADGARLVLPELDLSHVDELVTYVARGMEPYRGFPQFIQALAHIQERRPNCHAVIVGGDRVAYGTPLPDGQSYKDKLCRSCFRGRCWRRWPRAAWCWARTRRLCARSCATAKTVCWSIFSRRKRSPSGWTRCSTIRTAWPDCALPPARPSSRVTTWPNCCPASSASSGTSPRATCQASWETDTDGN
jgi:glycosyltransferase involved in cell wall biosynthesis